jgi:hypothetical protein
LSSREKEARHKDILDFKGEYPRAGKEKMRKEELIIPSAIAVFLLFPSFASAANLDGLKADFLQGNYRRVILEASVQAGISISRAGMS